MNILKKGCLGAGIILLSALLTNVVLAKPDVAVKHATQVGQKKPRPTVLGVSHVAITVRNMDNEVSFYRDLLGFKVKSDDLREGLAISKGVGEHHVKLRNVKLQAKNGMVLELIQYIKPRGKPAHPNAIADFDYNHMGLQVADAGKVYQQLTALGVQTVSPPVKTPGGKKFFYAYDPEQNRIEFFQMA